MLKLGEKDFSATVDLLAFLAIAFEALLSVEFLEELGMTFLAPMMMLVFEDSEETSIDNLFFFFSSLAKWTS